MHPRSTAGSQYTGPTPGTKFQYFHRVSDHPSCSVIGRYMDRFCCLRDDQMDSSPRDVRPHLLILSSIPIRQHNSHFKEVYKCASRALPAPLHIVNIQLPNQYTKKSQSYSKSACFPTTRETLNRDGGTRRHEAHTLQLFAKGLTSFIPINIILIQRAPRFALSGVRQLGERVVGNDATVADSCVESEVGGGGRECRGRLRRDELLFLVVEQTNK